jgi:hypothetical protein
MLCAENKGKGQIESLIHNERQPSFSPNNLLMIITGEGTNGSE